MKERIVITDSQAIDEWNRTIACYVDTDNSIYKARSEQVPETWEDLQELCRALALIVRKETIEFWGETIGTNMIFCKNGDIFLNTDEFFATERTPAQMWNIIQSLFFKEEEK